MTTSDRISVLLWHLGRHGGGPLYTYELARALQNHAQLDLHLCLSKQSELFGRAAALGLPTLGIDTYSGLISAALATTRLPFVLRQMSNYMKEHGIDVALCT